MTSLRSYLAAILAFSIAGVAHAQTESTTLPIERFRPAIDDKGLGTTEGGAIPSHLGWQTGLILNYALNPLVIRNPEGGIVAPIVAHRLGGDLLFTIGIFDYVSVGVDLPLLFVQTSGTIPDDIGTVLGVDNGIATIGVGDLKLIPKVRLLREDRHFVSLSIIPALTFPTAGGFNLADGSY